MTNDEVFSFFPRAYEAEKNNISGTKLGPSQENTKDLDI